MTSPQGAFVMEPGPISVCRDMPKAYAWRCSVGRILCDPNLRTEYLDLARAG
jgi:hypothetical protein